MSRILVALQHESSGEYEFIRIEDDPKKQEQDLADLKSFAKRKGLIGLEIPEESVTRKIYKLSHYYLDKIPVFKPTPEHKVKE